MTKMAKSAIRCSKNLFSTFRPNPPTRISRLDKIRGIVYSACFPSNVRGFDFAKPVDQWQLSKCFGLLRRRLEAADEKHGTRSYIGVLRLLERHSLSQLTDAIEYALDIDVIDSDSIRVILQHRSEKPAELFSPDGRPQLKPFNVETTDVSAYAALLSAR